MGSERVDGLLRRYEKATALAEQYGTAIIQISKILNDEDLSPTAARIRARVVIAGLAPEVDGV